MRTDWPRFQMNWYTGAEKLVYPGSFEEGLVRRKERQSSHLGRPIFASRAHEAGASMAGTKPSC